MKWKILKSEEILKLGYFRIRKDQCEMPDGRVMPAYYTLDFSDWVNVIPITREGRVVLIRQYRHSVEDTIVEVPGGATDPKLYEDPKVAALRELEEETGYTSSDLRCLGVHYPNPALLSNRMHTYVALNCAKVQRQNLDPYEDIEVFEVSKKELMELVRLGKIQHSIILASLLLGLEYIEDKK